MQTVYLIASGDLRPSANKKCQAAQAAMEVQLGAAFARAGAAIQRAHQYNPQEGHGFIDSQKYGMEVFRKIPANAPLVVAEAVWQYSQHVLAGLFTHRGPILTVANWSGTWPGLVGMLNLNGSLTKAGIRYSSLWSEDFTDPFFGSKLQEWLESGAIRHDATHVRAFDPSAAPAQATEMGQDSPGVSGLQKRSWESSTRGAWECTTPSSRMVCSIRTGVFKERLSQSSLFAKMQTVTGAEAQAVFDWYVARGLRFRLGKDEESELTRGQVLDQCKMYVAAVRIADEFGCAAIGIQYQQGLKDLAPASDLVEGTLNNVDRPPVYHELTGAELFAGEALPHFNEVDECAGLDGLVTYRLWRELGFAPENTLHDLRWGRQFRDGTLDAFVWVLLISGAAPPAHFIGGWSGASSERQPPMYFRMGGGSLKGVSKPGWIVWSRVYVEDEVRLKFDTGLAEVVELPAAETEDRWQQTTPQWPIMHAVLQGITRDQMMARHKANHIQAAYAPDKAGARLALYAKAAAMAELGLEVAICGEV